MDIPILTFHTHGIIQYVISFTWHHIFKVPLCCSTDWYFILFLWSDIPLWDFPGGLVVENPLACRSHGFNPWVGKIPCRRKQLPTPVPLPGNSHGQGSLLGYSAWGLKRVGHDLVTKNNKYFTV